MTLDEFSSKPLTTNADAAAALRVSAFAAICSHIGQGEDSKVMQLLNALWLCRPLFSKEQTLEALVRALFPEKGCMRWAASVTAMRLAKAMGCEEDLQRIVQERWSSIDAGGCTEIALGLSGNKDVAGWMPVLPVLFELNRDYGVRTQLVRAVNNMVGETGAVEARRLLCEFLSRMPLEPQAGSDPACVQFVEKLKANWNRE